MELQCKVIRGRDAAELEAAVNRFLADEVERLGEIQFEEITQSEGAVGVTVVIWYSRALNDDERGGELADVQVPDRWPEA